jgi:hypothetical protein
VHRCAPTPGTIAVNMVVFDGDVPVGWDKAVPKLKELPTM